MLDVSQDANLMIKNLCKNKTYIPCPVKCPECGYRSIVALNPQIRASDTGRPVPPFCLNCRFYFQNMHNYKIYKQAHQIELKKGEFPLDLRGFNPPQPTTQPEAKKSESGSNGADSKSDPKKASSTAKPVPQNQYESVRLRNQGRQSNDSYQMDATVHARSDTQRDACLSNSIVFEPKELLNKDLNQFVTYKDADKIKNPIARLKALGYKKRLSQALLIAKADAKALASNPSNQHIFIYGPHGTGKTFLATAIMKRFWEYSQYKYSAAVLNMPCLYDIDQRSFRNINLKMRLDMIMSNLTNVGLLIIDGIGDEPRSKWSTRLMKQLSQARGDRPLIITTAYSPSGIDDKLKDIFRSSFKNNKRGHRGVSSLLDSYSTSVVDKLSDSTTPAKCRDISLMGIPAYERYDQKYNSYNKQKN